MNITIPECLDEKIIILNKKYPVEEFRSGHNYEAYMKHKKEYRQIDNKNK